MKAHHASALGAVLLMLGCGADEPTPNANGAGAGAGGTQASGAAAGASGSGASAGRSAGGSGAAAGMSGASGGAGGAGGSAAGGGGVGASGSGSGGTQAAGGRGGAAGSGTGAGAPSGGRSTTTGGAAGVSGRGAAGASGNGSSGAGGSSAGAGGAAGGGPTGPVTVFIAGDSTVQNYTDTASTTDQAGWGQMLGARFNAQVTIQNRAIGGRTARRFVDEGTLDEILAELAAGDFFLVQFGTNDGNKTATYELDGETIPYYLDPATDFKTYLRLYIEGARAHDATPVLVTPPPRNSAYCTGGNGTGAHAQAMRELGTSDDVAVLDLNKKTVDYLTAICPSPTPEDFFLLKSDNSVDGTHFQENGARIMAGFVTDEMVRVGLPLATYLK